MEKMMSKHRFGYALAMLVILSLLIGTCGGAEPEPPQTKVPLERQAEIKPSAAALGMVTGLEDVRQATVRIESSEASPSRNRRGLFFACGRHSALQRGSPGMQ